MVGTSQYIENIPFRNALIIDNSLEEVQELKRDLQSKGISVVLAENYKTAQEIIEHRPEINFIVLDWYLNEEDPRESQLILDHLKDFLFAPVIIYTKQGMTGPELFIKERNLERIVTILDKEKLDGDVIFSEMAKWITDNPELKIFLKWSFEVEKVLNPVLWQIYNLEVEGLIALIKIMRQDKGVSHMLEEYDLVNLFLKVLSRKLTHNEEFHVSVSKDIQNLLKEEKSVTLDASKTKPFHMFERYISPPVSEPIWTGDILKKTSEEYFIVVTPVCDLCGKTKIEDVLMVRAIPLSKYRKEKELSRGKWVAIITNKKDRCHYLPYIEGCADGLVCRFDQIFHRNLKDTKEEINIGSLSRIATIDSPFIENLIQRMNAYLMRLGVRELETWETDKILEDTTPNHKSERRNKKM